ECKAAGHRNVYTASNSTNGAGDSGLDRRACEYDQVRYLAAVERQLEDARIFDHLSDSGASCFDQRRIRLDFHLLRYLTDLKQDIDHRIRVDLENDSVLDISPKTGKLGFQPIRTGRKVRENVSPCFIRNR